MKISTNVKVFHRVAQVNDLPSHDVGTNDSVVSGMGGSTDFEISTGSDVTYTTSFHQVVNTVEGTIGSAAITKFIYIKNTGFTSSDKTATVATDAYIKIGLGGLYVAGGFQLSAGESICFHGVAGGNDNLTEWNITSSVAATYVEIILL